MEITFFLPEERPTDRSSGSAVVNQHNSNAMISAVKPIRVFLRDGTSKAVSSGGWVYHVLGRANARMPIFTKDEDFSAFARVLEEDVARTGTRLLSYCLMGNHWQLVVWPREDDERSRFVGWLRKNGS